MSQYLLRQFIHGRLSALEVPRYYTVYMSTEQTLQIESTSLEDTLQIAEAIGKRLRGGEVIELVSDLGGGKTTFVKGLARGMGSTDTVRSPSFTLSNVYKSSELTLHHYDFYRLDDPGILKDELIDIQKDSENIIVIEWAETVRSVLSNERITLNIKVSAENSREFIYVYSAKYSYLFTSRN